MNSDIRKTGNHWHRCAMSQAFNAIKFIQTTDSSIIQKKEKILSLLSTKLAKKIKTTNAIEKALRPHHFRVSEEERHHAPPQHIFLASKLLKNNTI